MKKSIYVLLLIALGWLVKLSYDFYQVSQQLGDIQQSLHKSEQKNASLNDQLVAVQRQTDAPAEDDKTKNAAVKEQVAGINPSVLIKQQLELVQFSIQQQQFVYAIEHLTALNQSLDHYALADVMKHSLQQTIAQDIQTIQHFVIEKNAQQDQFNILIKQLDTSLLAELKSNQLNVPKTNTEHFWQKWFRVDMVETDSPVIANRKFILKEAQLRLLLSQQLLMKGQSTESQDMLSQVIELLDSLPDASSQRIKQQIMKLKQAPPILVPKLNSLAVLG